MTNRPGRKTIILGNYLKAVQALGSNGISCISLFPSRQISASSRYGTYRLCPDPGDDERGAIDFLYDLCRKEGNSPVLLSTSDTWSLAVSRQLDRLSEVATPCVANREAVELVLDKERFCRLGQERRYMTPMSWTAEEVSGLEDDRFPIVAKPKVHRTVGNGETAGLLKQMDRLRFIVINDKQELLRFMDKEREWIPFLTFQEYVRGMSDTIYNIGLYADRSSEILGSVSGHKLRGYPASHGDCTLGERADLPDELMENARRIVKDIKLFGLAEFEYKKDLVTGEFKLIEINPRAWSWMGITPACGVNLPLMAYQDLTGAYDPSNFQPYRGTVRYIRLLDDLTNCLLRYSSDAPSWKRTFPEWFKDIRADRVAYYDFDRHDPLPSTILLAGFGLTFLNLLSKMFIARAMGTVRRSSRAASLRPTILPKGPEPEKP